MEDRKISGDEIFKDKNRLTDEFYCLDSKCNTSKDFQCDTGECIPQKWKCNGIPDCADGSDEPFDCRKIDITDYRYSMKTGNFINFFYLAEDVPCKPNQFQCKYTKKCIPYAWICDGEADCSVNKQGIIDNSDEDANHCMFPVTFKSTKFSMKLQLFFRR